MSLLPRRAWDPWWMLAPSLMLLGVFFAYPLVFATYTSLFRWDLLTDPKFVGFGNYAHLWRTGEMTGPLWRTLLFSLVVLVGSVVLGLLLALALNRRGRLASFLRSTVFTAYIVSWVSVALLWLWLLDTNAGLVPLLSAAFGEHNLKPLGDPSVALYVLAGITVWKVTGYSLVLFLAGLQDIPRSHFEAAALDGAKRWSRFWYITWPALKPTSAFVCVTTLILSFQAFDIVRVMTDGGPVHSTTVLVYSIYEHLFQNLRVGRASASVMVFFCLLLVLTIFQLVVVQRKATE